MLLGLSRGALFEHQWWCAGWARPGPALPNAGGGPPGSRWRAEGLDRI